MRKLEYPKNTTDLSKVTENLYHIMFYRVHLTWAGLKLATLEVIGSDCTGSCKSNYHKITTTMAPHQMGVNYYCNKLLNCTPMNFCKITKIAIHNYSNNKTNFLFCISFCEMPIFPSYGNTVISPSEIKNIFHCVTSQYQRLYSRKISLIGCPMMNNKFVFEMSY